MGITGRYEFVEGTSCKFWEVEKVDDHTFRASWGRIGKEAQSMKDYSASEIIKKIEEKTKKGYEKVS